MKFYICLFLFLLPVFSKAVTIDSVKIITLHPSVGNSIDLKEKKEFFLFPEYSDHIFESAQILKYNDSTYTLNFKTTSGKTVEKATNTKELDKMYSEIERLKPNEYVKTNKAPQEKKPKRTHSLDSAYWLGELIAQLVIITLGILINFSH